MPNAPRSPEQVQAARDEAAALVNAALGDNAPAVPVELLEFARTLIRESDRGCVLVAAAYLDDLLGSLLRAHFGADAHVVANAVDPLLKGGMAPLGTFSARSKLAYALGLIDRGAHDALKKVRELRNLMAHRHGPVELSDAQVRAIVETLPLPRQMVARATGATIHEFASETGFPTWSACRLIFISAFAQIGDAIRHRLQLAAREGEAGGAPVSPSPS